MAFEKIVPEWKAPGIEPPESLKTNGWEEGYKPPAEYFNWFMHGMGEAVKELQGMGVGNIGAAAAAHATQHGVNGTDPITPAMIGAAPVGYGLGVAANTLSVVADVHDISTNGWKSGWYRITADTANGIGANAIVRADVFSNVVIKLTAFTTQMSNVYTVTQVKECFNGTWGEWEWINPPLLIGIEYRTTERIEGKAVYRKKDSSGKYYYRLDGSDTWIEGVAGASPSGYGLGGDIKKVTTAAELDAFTVSGWKTFYNISTPLEAGGTKIYTGVVRCDAYSETYCVQTLASVGSGYLLQRFKSYDGWGEWGWINPPLYAGTEYRTTERYLGKPVYVKVFDFGALPNASIKSMAHNLSATAIVDLYGTSEGNSFFFPCAASNDSVGQVDLYIQGARIFVTTTVDWSDVNVYITVKYTKD